MAPQAGATSSSVDLAAVLEAQLRADTLRVPPYPAVATQLQRMVSDEHFGITEVSRVVSADASLAAMVLRRANAADMVGNGSASSLGAAVFRVGVDTVIRMAMAATVGAAATTNGPSCSRRSRRSPASASSR
jgi:HD-like signal output (HDOD) protein